MSKCVCIQGNVKPENSAPKIIPDSATRPRQPIKLALFIRNFRIGGAERQVLELAEHLDKRKYEVVVIALHGDGELKERFHSLPNLQVVSLEGKYPLAVLYRLAGVLRRNEIQILHSFLTATNIYSLFARLFLPQVKVIVGLRDSLPDFYMGYSSLKWRTKLWLLEFCLSRLRHLGDLYVSNSEAGKILYERKLRVQVAVVPNGINTNRFGPDPAARDVLRGAVGAPNGAKLVGILANFTIYKDYPTFVRAAKIITDKVQSVHFVSIGNDRTDAGAFVKTLVQEQGLRPLFHFLGTRGDVPELLPGLDVLCSSSMSEGFSGAIAEALACGVPCVVTDVGDSRKIVGETGIVIPAGDYKALAAGVVTLLNMNATEMQTLRSAARQRIVENFGTTRMATEHEHLYELLLTKACSDVALGQPTASPRRPVPEVR